MSLFFIKGSASIENYETICRAYKLNPEDKKVIFLFPGNSSHHGIGTTLFSIKSGGGLAQAAKLIGEKGYPTLSLPTTTMEQWSTNKAQQAIVQGAIVDLYKALGAGYSFMLPVRAHTKNYFDQGLAAAQDLEPSFWGGIQAAPNKQLANHYLLQLNQLSDFIALSLEKRQEVATTNINNPLFKAYLKGQQMQEDDPWLTPIQQNKPVPLKSSSTKPPQSEPAKPDEGPQSSSHKGEENSHYKRPVLKAETRASYEALYQSKQDALDSARALLNDYTKSYSFWNRFFHGHWNRHHVPEVNAIVKQIDQECISSVDELLKKLASIKLVNPEEGSLARRILFIEEKNSLDKDNTAKFGFR